MCLPLEEWQQTYPVLATAIREQSVITPTQLCQWEASYFEAFRSLIDYRWSNNRLVSSKNLAAKKGAPAPTASATAKLPPGKRSNANSAKQDEKRGHQPSKKILKEKETAVEESSTICKNCEKTGHHFKQCSEERVCFHCRKAGHTAGDCKNKKQTAAKSPKGNNPKKPNATVNVALVEKVITEPSPMEIAKPPGNVMAKIVLHLNNVEFVTVLDSGAQTSIMPQHLMKGLVGKSGPSRFQTHKWHWPREVFVPGFVHAEQYGFGYDDFGSDFRGGSFP